MTLHEVIGKNVYWARVALSLSQEAVSVRMGVSHSHFSAIENGRQNFTIEVLDRLSKALEIDAGKLFVTSTPPKPKRAAAGTSKRPSRAGQVRKRPNP